MKPRYPHECPNCKGLGHFGEYDLYFCVNQFDGKTVIARYGHHGDYMSGLGFTYPALVEAECRAKQVGLMA